MSSHATINTTDNGGSSRHRRQVLHLLRLIARAIASVLVLVPAVLVMGAFVPDVPVLGLATAIVGAVVTWFVVLPLLGALLAWVAWRRRLTRYAVILVSTGMVAAAGAGVITGRMVGAVEGAGADISLVRTLGVGQTSSAAPDDEPTYLTDQGDDLKVAVYRPRQAAPERTAPVLLYVHGGGWTIGTRADRSADMRWFADQGWLVLSVDYSLSDEERHLWDVTQAQVGCAVSWVGANAASYGGDASRLSITGDSAGGNLAINTAYLRARGDLPSTCGGEAPVISAVSVTYPGVDLAAIYDGSSAGEGYVTNYVGGSVEEFPERYEAVDSLPTISADAPPTLVLTGRADHLVPFPEIEDFVDRADGAGVETKLVTVPHADHVFDGLPGSIGQQAYRQLTAEWMRAHGQAP